LKTFYTHSLGDLLSTSWVFGEGEILEYDALATIRCPNLLAMIHTAREALNAVMNYSPRRRHLDAEKGGSNNALAAENRRTNAAL